MGGLCKQQALILQRRVPAAPTTSFRKRVELTSGRGLLGRKNIGLTTIQEEEAHSVLSVPIPLICVILPQRVLFLSRLFRSFLLRGDSD